MIKKNFNHRKAIFVVSIISTLFTASGVHAEERLSASETLTERTKEFLSDRGRTGSLLGSIIAGAAVANPLAPLLGSVAGFMIGKSSAFSNKDSSAARRQAYNNRSLIPEDGVQVTGLTGFTGNQSQASEQTVITSMFGKTDAGNQPEKTAPPLVSVNLPGEIESRTGTGTVTGTVTGTGTGTGIQSVRTEQIVIVESPEEPEMVNRSEQIDKLFIAGSPGKSGTDNQSEQTDQTVAVGLAENIEARINLQKQLAYACSNVELTQPLSSNCFYYSQ